MSEGQTGVDRGALDAALAAGIQCDGWCPAGRLAEDGRIPDHYPLRELDGGYPERTARNVADSDGTLVITFGEPQGGTRATIDCCIEQQKPHQVIDASWASSDEAAEMAVVFIDAQRIGTLNVAGPRASEAPEAHDYAFRLVTKLLESF
ncbi:MAG TPA: putative molybdenum carrier protein [Chthoniobacterales bacterium]|nr:putative molybdenum carrier protein [Chthoniobacterales bacterium]